MTNICKTAVCTCMHTPYDHVWKLCWRGILYISFALALQAVLALHTVQFMHLPYCNPSAHLLGNLPQAWFHRLQCLLCSAVLYACVLCCGGVLWGRVSEQRTCSAIFHRPGGPLSMRASISARRASRSRCSMPFRSMKPDTCTSRDGSMQT